MVIKLRPQIVGKYIEQTVFIGKDRNHLQHAGMIRVFLGEYETFCEALKLGAKGMPDRLRVVIDPPALTEEAFLEQVMNAGIEG